jgi:hypothetical protein
MMKPPFYAKEHSDEAKLYLFASAYWVLAADEQLTGEEQTWLFDQFGELYTRDMLEGLMAMESEEYFTTLADARERVPEAEIGTIDASLHEWLLSAAMADQTATLEEREILEKLDEIARTSALQPTPVRKQPPPIPPQAKPEREPEPLWKEPTSVHRRKTRRQARRNRRLLPGEERTNGMVLGEIYADLKAKGEAPYQANRHALRALDINEDLQVGVRALDSMLEGLDTTIDFLLELKEEANELERHVASIC